MKKSPKKSFYKIAVFAAITIAAGYWLMAFIIFANFREIQAGKIYRSAQPSEKQLKKWLGKYKIKTILNLRGDGLKITKQEEQIAQKANVKMFSFGLSSSKIPDRKTLTELMQVLKTSELPILIHCRAGVDRSGTISTIAAMAISNADYKTAKWQSYVPIGPWKRKPRRNFHHISDTLKAYELYCDKNNLDTAGWTQFENWITNANSSFDEDVEYCYNKKVNYASAVIKLIRQSKLQFSIELLLLALLAAVVYQNEKRKLKNKNNASFAARRKYKR